PNLIGGTTSDLYLYVNRTTGISEELGSLAIVGLGSDGEPAVIVPGEVTASGKHANVSSLRYGLGSLTPETPRISPELSWRLQTVLFKLGNLGIEVQRIETQQSNLERLFLQLTGKRLRD
ncbi:MAG: hypothetical protein WCH39_29890, partial [Schlesneria sp.]